MLVFNRDADKLFARTPEEIAQAMSDMANMLCEAKNWIAENTTNTSDTLIYLNLLSATVDNLNIFVEGFNGHISITALATRNLFEIYLQTIDILSSPKQMLRWKGECITDDSEMIERFVSSEYVKPRGRQRAALKTRIRKLQSDRQQYGFHSKPPELIIEIAKRMKQETEYATLYRYYSKLIHPTSYLVNNYDAASSKHVLMLFQMFAQKYAVKTFASISNAVDMPKDAIQIPESIILNK